MLGHFHGLASSTVPSWLYGSSSVDRAEAGTAGTPVVIRGDTAPETVCRHHEVGTRSKRNPNSHTDNLWKCARAISLHIKIKISLAGKPSLSLPQHWPDCWVQSVSKLKFAGACGFLATSLAHSVFVWGFVQRKYLSVTCSRSWFSPFLFIWLLGGSLWAHQWIVFFLPGIEQSCLLVQ